MEIFQKPIIFNYSSGLQRFPFWWKDYILTCRRGIPALEPPIGIIQRILYYLQILNFKSYINGIRLSFWESIWKMFPIGGPSPNFLYIQFTFSQTIKQIEPWQSYTLPITLVLSVYPIKINHIIMYKHWNIESVSSLWNILTMMNKLRYLAVGHYFACTNGQWMGKV